MENDANVTKKRVTKVLLFLKHMIYESTSPLETLRFAKYYKKNGLDVIVVLWGPMGVILGKKSKQGAVPDYDKKIKECMELGVRFKCCSLASGMIGMGQEELIDGIELIDAQQVAELFLEYTNDGQMIINL